MLTNLLLAQTDGLPKINAGTPSSDFIGIGLVNYFMSNIGYLALALVIVGLVLSAGLWAVGAFSNNYTQSVNGKKGFMICAASALVIGAANAAVAWFYDQGTKITSAQ